MTLPAYRQLIDTELAALSSAGAQFRTRTRLAEHIALSSAISSRTVMRYLRQIDVRHLIGDERSTRTLTDDSHPAVTEADEAHTARPHAGPFPSPSSAPSPRSAALPGLDDLNAASALPADSTLHRPAVGGVGRSRFAVGGARPCRNRFEGECVVCAMWVDAGEGWLFPVPYPRTSPTPLHCAECFARVRALDRELDASLRQSTQEVTR